MTNPDSAPHVDRKRNRSLLAKGAAVLAVAGAVTCAGATAAMAAETPSPPRQEQFKEVIAPFDSISIPTMQCMSGWLEDVDYSPGRWVPRGVEVSEPGSVGVTASKSKYGTSTDGQTYPIIGFDSANGRATATNWNPFESAELTVTLHCTGDWDKAAKTTFLPGFAPEF